MNIKKYVDAIIEDLSDRRGLGDIWDEISEDIQEEIKEKWIKIAEECDEAWETGRSLEKENKKLRDLLCEIPMGKSSWEWDEDRVSYVEVQIEKETLIEIEKILKGVTYDKKT